MTLRIVPIVSTDAYTEGDLIDFRWEIINNNPFMLTGNWNATDDQGKTHRGNMVFTETDDFLMESVEFVRGDEFQITNEDQHAAGFAIAPTTGTVNSIFWEGHDSNGDLYSGSIDVNIKPKLPLVMPVSAASIRDNYGVCIHANFGNSVYQFSTDVVEAAHNLGIKHLRTGMFSINAKTRDTVAACRQYGMKLNVIVATEASTSTDIVNIVDWIANNASDVVVAFEGLNEPNPPGLGNVAWVSKTVDTQRFIWLDVNSYTQLDHCIVRGPAMHDLNLDGVNGAHWSMLANAGIRQYMDECSCHCYPGGKSPRTKMDERLDWIKKAFGDIPVAFTEWGYTDAMGKPKVGGHATVPAMVAEVYDMQALFSIASANKVYRYELLDDPNVPNTITEANFGLYEVGNSVGSVWTKKPNAIAIQEFLLWAGEEENYSVQGVSIETYNIPADVRTCLVQNVEGLTRLYAWIEGDIWSQAQQTGITLGERVLRGSDSDGQFNMRVTSRPSYIVIN